ncbi:MAG: TerB family tellurite resistance protein [Pseudomonadota bacterium]
MFTTIQGLLKKYTRTTQEELLDHEQALRTATVALLMEVARADHRIKGEERQAIQRIIERYYSVSAERAREIADAAENHANDMTSLYPLTRLITNECSLEERIVIVRLLWEVTFSDGHVDKHEEHLVRKVAELLYVPHNQFIRTRLQESGS